MCVYTSTSGNNGKDGVQFRSGASENVGAVTQWSVLGGEQARETGQEN